MDINKPGWVGAHSGMAHHGSMSGKKNTGGKKNPTKMKEKGPKKILDAKVDADTFYPGKVGGIKG